LYLLRQGIRRVSPAKSMKSCLDSTLPPVRGSGLSRNAVVELCCHAAGPHERPVSPPHRSEEGLAYWLDEVLQARGGAKQEGQFGLDSVI